jgi:DNA polymerase
MNWQEILQSVNFPTTVVVLDFETYWTDSYSLKKMSTIEYVTDSRFEIIGLGLGNIPDGCSDTTNYKCDFILPDKIINFIKFLKNEFGQNLERCTVVGQNISFFDNLVLSHHFGIIPKYTIDILNLARHEDSQRHNDLEHLCKYYNISVEKGDIKQFKGLTYKQMSPTLQKRLAEYCKIDVIAETELFKLLLPKLSNPDTELRLADHTSKMYLQPRLNFDFELADKLIIEMKQELDKILSKVNLDIKTIRSNKFVEILQQYLPENERAPMKYGKRGSIPALAKTDEAFQVLLNHPKDEVRNLAQARLAAKSWPTHIKRVQGMIAQAKAWNGKIAVPLRYYAAHTGRFGGTEGINLQNLPGVGRAGSGTHPLLSKIRGLLVA